MGSLQALFMPLTTRALESIRRRMARVRGSALQRNILAGSVSSVGSAIIAFVSYPIYLHYLGYDSYGLWLAMSSVVMLSQLGCSGITAAVAKLVAEEYNDSRFPEALAFISTATILVLVLSGTVAFSIWMLGGNLHRLLRLPPGQAAIFRSLLPFILALSVYSLIVEVSNAALIGMGALERLGYIQVGTQLIAIGLSSMLLRGGFGIGSLVISGVMSAICQHLMTLGSIGFLIPVMHWRGLLLFDRKQLRRISSFGGWMAAASVVNLLLSPLNRFVLARWCGTAAIPVYEIAFSGSMRLRGTMEAGLRALTPAVSGASARGGQARVEQLHAGAIRQIFLLGLPIYATLWIGASYWLRLWLGVRFNPLLTPAIRIMLVGAFASLVGVPAYYLLLGLDRPRDCFLGQCLQGSIAFSIIALLIGLGLPVTVGMVCLAAACGMIATSLFLIARLLAGGSSNPNSVRQIWFRKQARTTTSLVPSPR